MSAGLTAAIALAFALAATNGLHDASNAIAAPVAREVTARRELYRRCSRMGDSAVDVAERIVYAGVKGS